MKNDPLLPWYDEEERFIKNYNPKLMPTVEVEMEDGKYPFRLVEYRKEEKKVYLEEDYGQYLFETTPNRVKEDLNEVMEDLYEKAKNL